MKKFNEILVLICLFVISSIHTSCTDNDMTDQSGSGIDGAPLTMYVSFDGMTRVGELPNVEAINDAGTSGLNNIGLYLYYTSDYNDNDLSKPYIRNMECRIEEGKLVPVVAEGDNPLDKDIYIYDYMTLVAFYPYNAEMSLQENWFKQRTDEENYPITRSDYSEQTYIPYRGQVNVNPTTAFYIELTLYPKHTFRMEIILVNENPDDFNDGSPDIKILPAIDPVDNEDPETDGKREKWYDFVVSQDNTGGGMHVRRYVAYIWQDDEMNHVIEQNDILYQDGNFSLLATEQVNPREQRAYRYGYNFTTGESFIPTSSNLINDANRLQAFSGNNTSAYQVCDIDLTGVNFTPISMINSTYDGGGHKISNLSVTSSAYEAGLFSQIVGNSNLKNVNLIDPVITVNTTVDTCYVGALCGRVNNMLSEEELQNLYNSILLPDNLSEVVRAALLQEILADILNSQSQIIACRVENPVITVTGTHPRVGTVAGSNGDRVNSGNFRGLIWDTYSLGGSIT
ncbi:MAG: hypothetical protein LUG98_04875, partial [Tannerellaceae bacterium]|nr:hypothetical protein [Tannerellaceae bacterium]